MRIVILVLLALILASLGSALVFLLRDRGQGLRTVKALTWRIGLSFLLFALLIGSHALGLTAAAG